MRSKVGLRQAHASHLHALHHQNVQCSSTLSRLLRSISGSLVAGCPRLCLAPTNSQQQPANLPARFHFRIRQAVTQQASPIPLVCTGAVTRLLTTHAADSAPPPRWKANPKALARRGDGRTSVHTAHGSRRTGSCLHQWVLCRGLQMPRAHSRDIVHSHCNQGTFARCLGACFARVLNLCASH